ncbi:MAG: hypothetical protein PWR26_322 [Methanosarcinales archaeon]|nr:MAG: hypothetical protein XD46_0004 [Euryarchaeota archaeon 55_53]KUK30221.1 MAG: hypothetical protein XD62_0660 [Methanosarcinales archeaon 56_1174]MDI3487605.1 hypothetical protein [Methanosarcinales archaeon]MDN5294754.1 hypothetical protein [Methanosarcinales archaeon]
MAMDAKRERDILIERLENIIRQKDEEIASLRAELQALKEGKWGGPAFGYDGDEVEKLKGRLERLETTSKEMAATISSLVEEIIKFKSMIKGWEHPSNPVESRSEPKQEEKGRDILLY